MVSAAVPVTVRVDVVPVLPLGAVVRPLPADPLPVPEPLAEPDPLPVPEPLPVPLGVPTAAGGAASETALCVLIDSRKTRTATVLTIAKMTRRMRMPFGRSELEGFVVDLPSRHTGRAQRSRDGGGHAGRAAQVDVVLGEVGNVREERPGGQRILAELGAAAGDDP